MRHALLTIVAAMLVGAAPPAPRLTATGFGPLKTGMTRAQVVRAMGDDANPRAVGGPELDRCDEFHPRRAPAGVIVLLEDRRLSRVTATRAGVASDRGIRVGDPVARVRAAYRGQRLRDEPHKYVDAPARYLTWWAVPGRRGIRYEIDAKGRVSAIHAGGAAIEYVEGCL
jgi:hypothetical protein